MAVSLSARLGITRWGAGTDPLSRAQLDADHGRLDSLAALDIQVATLVERPAAAIRGRYCWVAGERVLFRDDGAAWHRVAETGADGMHLLRRSLANEKPAADPPSTYPLGMSTHTVGAAGDWPSANVVVTTQRPSGSRAHQVLSHQSTGRMWTRAQTTTDAWGRFSEVVETLRFTSTTRPTTDLYDGLRGFETDTLGTVVWQAANNRWVYESELRFTSTTRPTVGLYDGLRGYETDTGRAVIWRASDSRWIYQSPLRVTSGTRPTTNLYDGLRAYETDTGGTIVWQAASSRWIYESFQVVPFFSGFRATTQSIPNGAWTTVNWDGEEYDTAGSHAAGAAAFVAPHTGFYRAFANLAFAFNASNNRAVRLLRDGAQVRGSGAMTTAATSTFEIMVCTPPMRIHLTAGSQLTAQAWQSSGAALNITPSGSPPEAFSTIFQVEWDGAV